MKDVDFNCTNFSSLANGLHKISIDWVDLVWAAVTYGKRNASQLLAFNWHSVAELIVRAHSVYAYLRSGAIGYEKSDLYSNLDATEKGAASYFVGMTMCKIFSDQKLSTPWLFHVSLASSNGASVMFSKMSEERPDLLGITSASDWIVAEAKGRSRKFSKKALVKAKKQSAMIQSINGKSPIHRFGIESYFDPHLKVEVDDPPASREAYPVEIDVTEALRAYYAIASAFSHHGEERRIRDELYLVTKDVPSGISLGLPARVARRTSWEPVLGEFHRTTERISEREKLYSDGIYIALDERWHPEKMQNQPTDRGRG